MSGLPARRRRIETENVGDVTIVRFVDRAVVGEQIVQMAGDDLFRLPDELGGRKVLLDFASVDFISSAILGKIITLHRKMVAVRGRVVLCRMNDDTLEMFKIVRLDRIFTIATGPNFLDTGAVIREFFGNPYRPAVFSPEWRTDTVVLLARQMYDSREFSAMPILADALQDAGCDNEDVLTHCRDVNQPHVRGCWVVDLVFGKE